MTEPTAEMCEWCENIKRSIVEKGMVTMSFDQPVKEGYPPCNHILQRWEPNWTVICNQSNNTKVWVHHKEP